eukprot:scaffold10494_cov53-Phaeocystis_antarctica.AAC.8
MYQSSIRWLELRGLCRQPAHLRSHRLRHTAAGGSSCCWALGGRVATAAGSSRAPTVAASHTYGCRRVHPRLQPRTPTVAGACTHGCSLAHLRLQVRAPTVAASHTYGCRPSCATRSWAVAWRPSPPTLL